MEDKLGQTFDFSNYCLTASNGFKPKVLTMSAIKIKVKSAMSTTTKLTMWIGLALAKKVYLFINFSYNKNGFQDLPCAKKRCIEGLKY